METQSIFFLLLALMFSALFSGLEFAFISANKFKIELRKQKGGLHNHWLYGFFQKPAHFLSTTLMGNNIALVLFGILFSKLVDPYIASQFGISNEFLILLIDTLITTAIILIFGEFIPKNTFGLKPEPLLAFFIIPFKIIYYILFLPVSLVLLLSRWVIRIFTGEDFKPESLSFTALDLKLYVEQTAGKEEEESEIDADMFGKAIDLTAIKARKVMVPRTEIEALNKDADLEELRELFIESGYSKIIIYDENIDQPIGYAHHLDVLKGVRRIYELPVVPESITARDLLHQMMSGRKSIAIVADEYGGTAGLVTLEDLIEEIFGEIEDEHDEIDAQVRKLSPTKWMVAGRAELDWLNENYGIELEKGEYETLAGYLLYHHESMPQKGQKITIGEYEFQVIKVSDTRIEVVKLTKIKKVVE